MADLTLTTPIATLLDQDTLALFRTELGLGTAALKSPVAAVNTLLDSANAAALAVNAVNGQAIAPSSVSATGNLSGAALYVTGTGANTETAGLTNGASDVNFRLAIKNGSGTTTDSEQAWVGLTYAGDKKAGLSFWRGGGTDGAKIVFSTGTNTEIMSLTNAAGAVIQIGLEVAGKIKPGSYTVATLPAGTAGALIYVTDAAGGPVHATYNGTNWVRAGTQTVIA